CLPLQKLVRGRKVRINTTPPPHKVTSNSNKSSLIKEVGGSFYLILLRFPLIFGRLLGCPNTSAANFSELLKGERMFSGCKSDVTASYAEYHVGPISFSRLLVGLSQCCVLPVVILISQSTYF